tara:strand:- start:278 stop:1291 length:1014 start_codon:yes stop_codon:yes gene_type:complete
MKEFTSFAVTFALMMIVQAVGQESADQQKSFAGHWALKMSNGAAGWLTLELTEGEWSGQLWTVGEPKAIKGLRYANGKLAFKRALRIGPPEYPGGPYTGEREMLDLEASVQGNEIRVVMKVSGGQLFVHSGKRLPPLPPRPDLSKVNFGQPIELFNGVDLTGWKLINSRKINGWKVKDGELVNETPKKTFDAFAPYGNLRTERVFGDSRLTIEFNVPPGGNSGIYVRGAYEAQVVDRNSRMQGLQGVGAIFSRVKPTKNAGKPGGKWQSYEITIVDRHATVVLNGETVIDNQLVIGNTNGAFQADVTRPGPLHLQGDHTSVRYRKIVLYPVLGQTGG